MPFRTMLLGLATAGATFAMADSLPASEAPAVVVTIKPVHSLTAGVMQGVGRPRLLIAGSASEHGYSMKPSDARALHEADLVVRVSDRLETFLDKPLQLLSARAVTLDEIDGLTLLAPREGGVWERHTDEDHDHETAAREEAHRQAKESHGDDHGDSDVHIWLDPENVKRIVTHLADVLGEVDPGNAALYRANADRVRARLSALHAELMAAVAPLKGKPYIVFHDAYQYFERRYGLAAAGSITFSPERQPGARRVAEIRKRIEQLGATCVFAEPQFEPKLVQAVIAGTKAKSGVLDPLGAALEPGPELYFALMRGLARSLADCLL